MISPQRTYRALFITHDAGFYGASRSLQLLLRNYPGIEIDLVVARRIIGGYRMADLRQRFGERVRSLWKFHLPIDYCYRGKPANRLLLASYRLLLRLFWSFDRHRLARVIDTGGYDFIHLNSLVLHGLINRVHPFILHVREVYDGSNPAALQAAREARGLIFIDEATGEPFRDLGLTNSIILNNPIDMVPAAAYRDYRPSRKDVDPDVHTVFSMIGVASEDKGTRFVIQTFMKMRHADARLLIVGGRERPALARYRRIARSDPRIIFWGEEPDIMKIYAISDYVLRGEAFPCVGRTVYEGLYAGCRVIVPGVRDTPPPMFEQDRFRDDIYFYAPRNESEFLNVLSRLVGNKVRDRDLRSNTDAYVQQFRTFILSVLQ